MINLRVLVPEVTYNYVTNPAFRFGTTGWVADGATLTRSLDFARFGIASGKVVTNGAVVNEGIYFIANISFDSPITASVYVRGRGKVRLRLINSTAGTKAGTSYITNSSKTNNLSPDRWTRLEVSGFSSGKGMILSVETDGKTPSAITFYVDGAQVELKPYATSYCDGDQEGCRWNIVEHGSISERYGKTNAGGRWVALAGPCRPNNDLYVTVLGGLGMPPITNQIQSWANAPGSFFQNYKIQNRAVTLNFFAKKEDGRTVTGTASMRFLHELRQQLIDIIKPDKIIDSEAFLFEYSDTEADKPLYMRLRYEAGLEGSWDIRNRWYNSFPVRMIAVDPLWSEDTQDVFQMVTKTSTNSVSSKEVWGRTNREWNAISNTGGVTLSNAVLCSVEGLDGAVYFGGNFTSPASYVVKWDGSTLSQLAPSSTGADAAVRALAVGPDGTIYVGGDFLNIGGIAANRIAKFNPTTRTFTAMGAGMDGVVYAISVAQNGQVYAGGNFTTAGGVACAYIARWDGFQWRTVGASSGLNNIVRCIAKGLDPKTLYVGGQFTASNGGAIAYGRVVSINTDTALFSVMGTGFQSTVFAMTVGLDGAVYAGGSFTKDITGLIPILGLAKWSGGNRWEQVGSGVDSTVFALETGLDGEIYATGLFLNSGTRSLPHAGKWFGNNFNPIEFYNVASYLGPIYTFLVCRNGDLYLGQDTTSGGAPYVYQVPKSNNATNNGSAFCWPILYLKGQGTLRYLCNIRTGQEIFLNLPILANEEVQIDFARGTITSKARGDLLYSVLSGSEIRSIYLLPGANPISILITDDVTAIAQLRWTPQDWSSDSVVDAEAL